MHSDTQGFMHSDTQGFVHSNTQRFVHSNTQGFMHSNTQARDLQFTWFYIIGFSQKSGKAGEIITLLLRSKLKLRTKYCALEHTQVLLSSPTASLSEGQQISL